MNVQENKNLYLYLSPPLELFRPLYPPLRSKTSEMYLPVLSHIAPLPFSLDKTLMNECLGKCKKNATNELKHYETEKTQQPLNHYGC
jgi:hypothetical protein